MAYRTDLTRALVATALAITACDAQAQDMPGAAPNAPVAAIADAPPAGASQIDPARLAAARITVDHVFPVGTYARLLGGPLGKLMDGMMGGVGRLPLGDLAAIGGAKPEDVAKMPKATLDDIMAIYDPAYHQRMTVAMHAMMGEMGGLFEQIEPGIRDGLVQAYAIRFSLDQLDDINRFFDTPSGAAYAANAAQIGMDPAVMAKMQGVVPLLMKRMPDIMKKIQADTAALPKPRKWSDMTADEHHKLALLFGESEEQLARQAARKEQAAGK